MSHVSNRKNSIIRRGNSKNDFEGVHLPHVKKKKSKEAKKLKLNEQG